MESVGKAVASGLVPSRQSDQTAPLVLKNTNLSRSSHAETSHLSRNHSFSLVSNVANEGGLCLIPLLQLHSGYVRHRIHESRQRLPLSQS
jgi:hypothetical protein